MEFYQYEQKLTTEELAAFEQQYNITLPKAFKEHYLQYNGGYPPYENVKGTKHLSLSIASIQLNTVYFLLRKS